MDSLTPKEIKMKEDLHALYEGLQYEKGFGPFEVKPSMQRKQLTHAHAIVGTTNSLERKYIFGEDGKSSPIGPFFL